MTSFEEYTFLLRRSQSFLVEAEEALEHGGFDLACFFAEQAVQLFLKAILLKLTGDYPKTHSLRTLLSKLVQELPEDRREVLVEFTHRNRARISELEDAYITARYIPEEFSCEDVQDLVKLAKGLIELLRKLCDV